jgi:hypothetical protein
LINNDVNCGGFIYCTTHWGPHEKKLFHNVGNGLWHQYTYLIDGQLEIEFREDPSSEVISKIDTRTFNHDGSDDEERLIDHLMLPKYETITTKDEGTTVMFFNPLDITRLLDVKILREGTHKIEAIDKRVVIICIVKEAYANGNKMIAMQFATVWEGKTAELVIQEHGVCAVVKYADNADQVLDFMLNAYTDIH